ncbi:hypothetical protein SESBI_34463 [Sesbania bispinosa]|nr:hypothetical protein SESBI_34463 [Sesbania bispinosa]
MAPNTTGVAPPVLIMKVSSSPTASNQQPIPFVDDLKESIWSKKSRSPVKICLTKMPSFTPPSNMSSIPGKSTTFEIFNSLHDSKNDKVRVFPLTMTTGIWKIHIYDGELFNKLRVGHPDHVKFPWPKGFTYCNFLHM